MDCKHYQLLTKRVCIATIRNDIYQLIETFAFDDTIARYSPHTVYQRSKQILNILISKKNYKVNVTLKIEENLSKTRFHIRRQSPYPNNTSVLTYLHRAGSQVDDTSRSKGMKPNIRNMSSTDFC